MGIVKGNSTSVFYRVQCLSVNVTVFTNLLEALKSGIFGEVFSKRFPVKI
jgi:hypothetical protein